MKWIRRLLIFILGIILIFDSIINNFHVFEFIVGLIMIGLIPVDSIVDGIMGSPNDEESIKRLREVYKPDDKE